MQLVKQTPPPPSMDKGTLLMLLPALNEAVARMNADVMSEALAAVKDGTLDGDKAVDFWLQISANCKIVKKLQVQATVE